MPTDWSARTAAIEHFEKLVKQLKRTNDDDKGIYEAALHALRRSQDHTAIQTKLTETVRENERLKQLLATTLDGEEGIHVSTGGKPRDEKLFSARDVQAFTAIGFAIRKKHEAERAAKLTVTEQPMELFDVLQAECGTSIAERLVEAICKAGLRVEMTWQSIETAPKDMKDFLGLECGSVGIYYRTPDTPDDAAISHGTASYPTHWMPLPAAPVTEPQP